MKVYSISYSHEYQVSRFFGYVIIVFCICFCLTKPSYASGGYDNGTSCGKGIVALDVTWNPFNYFKHGQSYIVLSYGLTEKIDIHGYYSRPVDSEDNYYYGIFYQFYKKEIIDLSTALGFRKYRNNPITHLFAPQILYTFNIYNQFRIGGSLVAIRDIDKNYELLGTSIDISMIIPIFSFDQNHRLTSLDFSFGLFRPVLWDPNNFKWHPTYSIDLKFKL